jgi:hypothetical protein
MCNQNSGSIASVVLELCLYIVSIVSVYGESRINTVFI